MLGQSGWPGPHEATILPTRSIQSNLKAEPGVNAQVLITGGCPQERLADSWGAAHSAGRLF